MRVCRVAGGILFVAIMAWAQSPSRVAPKVSELDRAIAIFKAESANLGLRQSEEGSMRSDVRPTKSKTLRWHGRFFENFRNNFLDAVPHEVRQRGGSQGLLRRNQFGLNLTGPVVIPKFYNGDRKTFFTFTFEGVREKIGIELVEMVLRLL